ncbi:4Fe-4S binding domain [Moorella glycerini]|uniref:2-oxoglutarate-acceptor oxidoreductase subunit OorD n=1 Tax=Neomoorella stamsii TaxID=1266720 RepID=A0A9X7J4W0_9FIRM|nr:2-oxoglutarate-acceptor oxidoreductase subunit OorD [Moorella stamsii]CEP67013.1 4Fe-4S binding domain [Moorella glycerini]
MPRITINIDPNLCKGCKLCIANCHRDVFEMSTERGKLGYLMPMALHLENCTACLLCELTCPDMAIEVLSQS